jgi:heptosyltransferase-1
VVFLHGTTWDTKHWPEAYWRELAERVGYLGVGVKLPGQPAEKARAERIAAGLKHAEVLPKLNLAGVGKVLAGAQGLRGGGHRPGSPGRRTGCADDFAVRPDQPGPDRRLRQGADSPGQRLSCAPCLQKKCTYQPTAEDARRFDLKREWPLCFTRLNPERVASRLSTLLLAEELR